MNPFKLNELVWTKFNGYPWWPAVIKKEISNNEIEVYFCGDDAKTIINKTNIKKWAENFDSFASNIDNEDLLFSIGIALKLQEEEFNFNDHSEFIKTVNREELITEMKEFISFIQNQRVIKTQGEQNNFTITNNETNISKEEDFVNKKRKKPKEEICIRDRNDKVNKVEKENDEKLLLEINKEISEMNTLSCNIKLIKDKILAKIDKGNKRYKINNDYINKLKELVLLTESYINSTFPNMLLKVKSYLQFDIKNINPLLFYNTVISIHQHLNKENNENYLIKYEGIYNVITSVLNRINSPSNQSKGSEVKKKKKTNLPELKKLIEIIMNNESFEYNGIYFKNLELTNKYAKYSTRKKVREVLLELFAFVFNKIDAKFLKNAIGGLETICFKLDRKIGKEYIISIKKIIQVMKEYTHIKEKFPIEKEYNLSIHF